MTRFRLLVACLVLGSDGPGRGEDLEIITVDGQSGEPIPARVSVQDADGT